MAKLPNHTIVIRKARADEAPVLSDLALRSKGYWGYSEDFLEACRQELSYSPEDINSPDSSFAVAEIAGTTAGFYALVQLSATELELEALFVAPEYIGQGAGRALLEHAKQAASGRGGETLAIQGDPNAVGFYEAAGAIRTGERESGSIPGRFLPLFTLPLDG